MHWRAPLAHASDEALTDPASTMVPSPETLVPLAESPIDESPASTNPVLAQAVPHIPAESAEMIAPRVHIAGTMSVFRIGDKAPSRIGVVRCDGDGCVIRSRQNPGTTRHSPRARGCIFVACPHRTSPVACTSPSGRT